MKKVVVGPTGLPVLSSSEVDLGKLFLDSTGIKKTEFSFIGTYPINAALKGTLLPFYDNLYLQKLINRLFSVGGLESSIPFELNFQGETIHFKGSANTFKDSVATSNKGDAPSLASVYLPAFWLYKMTQMFDKEGNPYTGFAYSLSKEIKAAPSVAYLSSAPKEVVSNYLTIKKYLSIYKDFEEAASPKKDDKENIKNFLSLGGSTSLLASHAFVLHTYMTEKEIQRWNFMSSTPIFQVMQQEGVVKTHETDASLLAFTAPSPSKEVVPTTGIINGIEFINFISEDILSLPSISESVKANERLMKEVYDINIRSVILKTVESLKQETVRDPKNVLKVYSYFNSDATLNDAAVDMGLFGMIGLEKQGTLTPEVFLNVNNVYNFSGLEESLTPNQKKALTQIKGMYRSYEDYVKSVEPHKFFNLSDEKLGERSGYNSTFIIASSPEILMIRLLNNLNYGHVICPSFHVEIDEVSYIAVPNIFDEMLTNLYHSVFTITNAFPEKKTFTRNYFRELLENSFEYVKSFSHTEELAKSAKSLLLSEDLLDVLVEIYVPRLTYFIKRPHALKINNSAYEAIVSNETSSNVNPIDMLKMLMRKGGSSRS